MSDKRNILDDDYLKEKEYDVTLSTGYITRVTAISEESAHQAVFEANLEYLEANKAKITKIERVKK